MFWFIVALPLWLIGAFLILCAFASILIVYPKETPKNIFQQFISCFILGWIVLIIAAWMSH